ncbi:hypothetical protein M8C21_010241 [Ambrosia artemisiifolia]|uniref:Uncharacterized protein n=1 Tax=Ambrosia artemisiifolia TaxID=4212 RepID=A0AAD5G6Q4_AMBAR|nr:hypothetical protein M8C21_010241 [Ambrosia artemisiifolia]
MAGSRLVFGYGGMPVYDPDKTGSHNTRAGRSTFVRITAQIWADLLSSFVLYAMMNYLTNVWNLSLTHAAGIINIFNGSSPALAIVFVSFADAFLGDFYIIVLSRIAYSIGLILLSLSTPTFFAPCNKYKEECIGHTQKVLFFTALPLIVVGMAGHIASLQSFLGSQVSAEAEAQAQPEAEAQALLPAKAQAPVKPEPKAEAQASAELKSEIEPIPKAEALAQAPPPAEAQAPPPAEPELVAQASPEPEIEPEHEPNAKSHVAVLNGPDKAQLAFSVILVLVAILVIIGGGLAFPYIKPWSIRFWIPAICASITTVLFLTGSSRYTPQKPKGSPLTTILRVFVAASTKDFQQVTNFKQIYKEDDTQGTESLRWLDKAAIKFPDQALAKSWTLCTVREVEDTKTGIRMVPMLLPFIGTGLVLSLGTSYFLEQANHMDRKLGSIEIQIPIFFLLYMSFASLSQPIFNALLKRIPIPDRYHAATEIAVGMVLSILCCITAAIVEIRRLQVIRSHGLTDKSNERIPMSVFYLVPQFVLHAAVDGILTSGTFRLLNDHHIPAMMHKYLFYLSKFFLGLGIMANVLLVYIVENVTDWFQHTLNKSHLDRYYWTLAGLSTVNLVIYIILASFYNYKGSPLDGDVEGGK